MDTEDKILSASILLFSQKGFDGVTTKEIAQCAGVSEMTIFRHFCNKRNLFERAFAKYNCSPEFSAIFRCQLEGDIEKDLLTISLCYQEALAKNQKLILMQLRNGDTMSNPNALVYRFSQELITHLTEYFEELKQRQIITGDPKVLSVNFLAANIGMFLMFQFNNQELTASFNFDTCVRDYVKTFMSGILNRHEAFEAQPVTDKLTG